MTKVIAKQTSISHRTVDGHLRRLCKRFLAVDSIHLMTLTHPAGKEALVSHPGLTAHENGILHQRMKGVSLRNIGTRKGFRYRTGRQHTENIRLKTNTSSMRRAAALILELTMEQKKDEIEV